MSNLMEHMERFLGPIDYGWAEDADGQPMHFQIVKIPTNRFHGVVAFSTIGLGRHLMHSSTSGKTIRLELMTMIRSDEANRWIPALLHQVADEARRTGLAPLRGAVLGPRGPLVPGSKMCAFFVTTPAYFPDEFSICKTPEGSTVIAWLVPISASEVSYIQANGWEMFEDKLVEKDPDLVDWFRSPIL